MSANLKSIFQNCVNWAEDSVTSYFATMKLLINNTLNSFNETVQTNASDENANRTAQTTALYERPYRWLRKIFERLPVEESTNSAFGQDDFSDFTLLCATAVFSLFGLMIAFYVVYLVIGCLCWICCGSGSSAPATHDDASLTARWSRARTQHKSDRWFQRAVDDFEAAQNDINGESLAPEWACFKCYQSMVKCLMACITVQQWTDTEVQSRSLIDLASVAGDDQLMESARVLQDMLPARSGSEALNMMDPYLDAIPPLSRDTCSVADAVLVFRQTEAALDRTYSLLGR